MADGLVLYTYPNNKNAFKALIAAQYGGIKIDVPSFEMQKDNRTPEFLKLNPNGKVPTLKTPQGSVWESNAIARYVARLSDGLLGSTNLEAAQIEQWIDFSTLSLNGPLLSWQQPIAYPHWFPYNAKLERDAIAAVKQGLGYLEKHLTTHTYLVGDTISLADIITWSNLYLGYTQVFGEAFYQEFPAVTRWFITLANQPNFKAATGDVDIKKTPVKWTPPPKAEKPKAAEKPKEQTPAAPATPAQEEDTPKPAAKPKDPLAELPPSKMIMDSWKRLYSNTPAKNFTHCLNGFWDGADVPNSPTNEHFEGFDPEGYSIYFVDYKYPEENTVNFIVMNKVGGFLQRIDYVRKHAFAAMAILKDESKGTFPIKGLFLFRGQGIPPIMKEECYDVDLYNWTKADTSDPAQRKRIEALLNEDDIIEGLETVEVKVFK